MTTTQPRTQTHTSFSLIVLLLLIYLSVERSTVVVSATLAIVVVSSPIPKVGGRYDANALRWRTVSSSTSFLNPATGLGVGVVGNGGGGGGRWFIMLSLR